MVADVSVRCYKTYWKLNPFWASDLKFVCIPHNCYYRLPQRNNLWRALPFLPASFVQDALFVTCFECLSLKYERMIVSVYLFRLHNLFHRWRKPNKHELSIKKNFLVFVIREGRNCVEAAMILFASLFVLFQNSCSSFWGFEIHNAQWR